MGATVVLVEGGWSTAAVYEPLIAQLGRRGVRAVASDLVDPETGARMLMASPRCSARLRAVLDGVDGPIVLAGHSGGGIDVTEVGDHPDVVHLVYMSAHMPGAEVDQSGLFDAIRPYLDIDGPFVHFDPAGAREVFFEDLPADQVDEAVDGLVPQVPLQGSVESADPSWRRRPSTYVVFDADRAHPPERQMRWLPRPTMSFTSKAQGTSGSCLNPRRLRMSLRVLPRRSPDTTATLRRWERPVPKLPVGDGSLPPSDWKLARVRHRCAR